MKHLRQTLLFILLGFLLSACRHTADRLLSIEQLIRLKPDSALSLLRQIQYPERLSDSNGALYALLMTQVINQSSDEGHKSDSLISVAIDYYNEAAKIRKIPFIRDVQEISYDLSGTRLGRNWLPTPSAIFSTPSAIFPTASALLPTVSATNCIRD